MIGLHKTTIKDFDYPLFVIACANKENLDALNISPQLGIRCNDFKEKCKILFGTFLIGFEYSQESVEKFFGIRFCFLRIEKGEIRSFDDIPMIGSNVIYIHKK